MSLLDDVSIVVTPNGYKAGTLFGAIPVPTFGSDEITNGGFATDSDWSKGGGWSIGGGVATANGNANSNISQNIPLTVGNAYSVTYTVVNSSVGSRIGIAPQGTTIQIIRTSDGTYTETFTAATPSFYIRSLWNNGSPVSVDNVSVKEWVGADMDVTRATDATRVDENGLVEKLGANVPRIDYTGGGCPHILAEPQRTNVNTYSEDFGQSFYIKDSGVSVGTTNNVSPSGESNATKIDVTDNGRIYANVASDTYASSVFIKAGTFAYFKIGGVNIDLVAGTNANGTIDSLGSGWFRVGINYTGNRPFQIQAYPDGTYSSHTTTGDYYIWGSQIEAGSYATSYILTSGSTVTRNQDIFTRDGIGSLINSTEGVLFAEIAALATINNAADAISIGDGTIANQIAMWYSNATNQFKVLIRQSGNKLFAILTLTDAKAFIKVAISYKSGDMKVYINGVSVATSVSPFAFTAPLTLLDLGATGLGNFNGKVKQLQVYDTALTDDQLRQITQ